MTRLKPTAALLIAATLASMSGSAIARDRDGYDDGYRGSYGWQEEGDRYRDDRQPYRDGNYGQQQRYYTQTSNGYSPPQNGYYVQGNGGYRDPRYAGNGYGYQQRPTRYAYNYNDRYRCTSGSTGTIVGAIIGGLIGNGVAGRGDRTLGTVLGGGAGALAGNAIEKSNRRC